MDQKISTWIGFLIIFLVVFPTAWVCYSKWLDIEEVYSQQNQLVTGKEKTSTVSDQEKKKIDTWIKENNLNEYGDSKGTVYLGGSPLLNEMTGEQIDKYQYILKNHSDRPWNRN